jgi:beta-1,4-mannosyltransferase
MSHQTRCGQTTAMSTAKNKRFGVVVLPLDRKDVYQTSLARELAKLGVRTDSARTTCLFSLRSPRVWRAEILHLHWLSQIAIGPSRALSLLRTAAVAAQLLLLKGTGRKIVWTVHNLKNHENLHVGVDRWLSRFVARRADGLIVHCEFVRRELIDAFAPPRQDRIFVIPSGNYLDTYALPGDREESRRRLGLTGSGPRFLFFGNIRDYKGVPELIDAFRLFERPDARLHIVGSPRTPEMAADLLARIGEDHRIVMDARYVDKDRLQDYITASDVAVLPYRFVTTSAALLLAMSLARPCIVPRMGGLPEVMDESCGWFYDQPAVDGILGALNRAAANPDGLPAIGQAARQRAAEWGWAEAARKTLQLYEAVLASS